MFQHVILSSQKESLLKLLIFNYHLNLRYFEVVICQNKVLHQLEFVKNIFSQNKLIRDFKLVHIFRN